MKTHFSHKNYLRIAQLLLFFVVIIGLMIALEAGDHRPQNSGTLFASSAMAQEPAPGNQAHAPASDHQETETLTDATVFRREPMESLAQSLKEKQRELDEKEKALKKKEEQLKILQKEVEQNLAKTDQKLKQMEKISGQADQNRKQEITKWVNIYQSMSPQQAGKVFEGLEPGFALELLSQMEPKKAGKILGFVQPEKAIQLGKALKEKRL